MPQNPVVETDFEHMVTTGKLKKVALVACMSKALAICPIVVRDYNPTIVRCTMPTLHGSSRVGCSDGTGR